MRIIAGKFARRSLFAPNNKAIRPTTDRVRENLFNILAHWEANFFSQRVVLDLFSGTGALGLEALSRGAEHAFFVENHSSACHLITKNIKTLTLENHSTLLQKDATMPQNWAHIVKEKGAASLIFADPPYQQQLGERAFQALLNTGIIEKKAFFILEEAKQSCIKPVEGLTLLQKKCYAHTEILIYQYL